MENLQGFTPLPNKITMGIFTKKDGTKRFKRPFKEWPIVQAIGEGVVDFGKQVPGIGRFLTIIFDRGEAGKFSFKDFKLRDLWAFVGGGVLLYGFYADWWTVAQLTDFVNAIGEFFTSVN